MIERRSERRVIRWRAVLLLFVLLLACNFVFFFAYDKLASLLDATYRGDGWISRITSASVLAVCVSAAFVYYEWQMTPRPSGRETRHANAE
jgi:hypothetical protein